MNIFNPKQVNKHKKQILQEALMKHKGHRQHTADELGCSVRTVLRMINRYKIKE